MITLLAAIALAPGDTAAPFEPYWVSGEYKDTAMCPICEYGMSPMVFIWTQSGSTPLLQKIVKAVDDETRMAKPRSLFSFLVDANLANDDAAAKARLAGWQSKWKPQSVALLARTTNLKSALKNYKLESREGWSTVIYTVKGRTVVNTFVDPKGSDLPAIQAAIRALN